jgi:hypothetical protein
MYVRGLCMLDILSYEIFLSTFRKHDREPLLGHGNTFDRGPTCGCQNEFQVLVIQQLRAGFDPLFSRKIAQPYTWSRNRPYGIWREVLSQFICRNTCSERGSEVALIGLRE